MKNNDLLIAPVIQTDGGQYPLLNNSLNIKYIPQAVEYFTKYIDAFRGLGVTVNGLTLENEPLNYQGKSCQSLYEDTTDLLIQAATLACTLMLPMKLPLSTKVSVLP
jgi:hypothetical protein